MTKVERWYPWDLIADRERAKTLGKPTASGVWLTAEQWREVQKDQDPAVAAHIARQVARRGCCE